MERNVFLCVTMYIFVFWFFYTGVLDQKSRGHDSTLWAGGLGPVAEPVQGLVFGNGPHSLLGLSSIIIPHKVLFFILKQMKN